MNRITVLGNLCADAGRFDVETRNGNSSYVSFFVADYGTPTKKRRSFNTWSSLF